MSGIEERIRQARKKKGLTIAELATLAGVPDRTISNYERGERKVSSEYLAILNTQLGINSNWLLTGEGEMFLDGAAAQGESAAHGAQAPSLEHAPAHPGGGAAPRPTRAQAAPTTSAQSALGDPVDVLTDLRSLRHDVQAMGELVAGAIEHQREEFVQAVERQREEYNRLFDSQERNQGEYKKLVEQQLEAQRETTRSIDRLATVLENAFNKLPSIVADEIEQREHMADGGAAGHRKRKTA